MKIGQTIGAFLAALAIAYVLAAIFYTERNLAEQALVGIQYTSAQQAETYVSNFAGLWKYGAMIAIALLIGFAVAFGIKRVLRPLAPIAYPTAGAAAIFAMLMLIETQLGGGAGVASIREGRQQSGPRWSWWSSTSSRCRC